MSDERTKGPESEPATYNLLFVCSGNTCRSPMAEAIAQEELRRREWSHVTVASAGAAAQPGVPASACAVDVAAEHGLELAHHRARQLTAELIGWADLILTMSPAHLLAVSELGGGEKAALVTDFIDGPGAGESIEDPFGADCDAYRRAFDQIGEAVRHLLLRLEPILSP
jgi:protein-tyrosine-phosphatase